jgi:hypothetical protein
MNDDSLSLLNFIMNFFVTWKNLPKDTLLCQLSHALPEMVMVVFGHPLAGVPADPFTIAGFGRFQCGFSYKARYLKRKNNVFSYISQLLFVTNQKKFSIFFEEKE